MTPDPPPHPLPALTTYELIRYRRELEHALTAIPGTAPARTLLLPAPRPANTPRSSRESHSSVSGETRSIQAWGAGCRA
jgi:hypothetical protein